MLHRSKSSSLTSFSRKLNSIKQTFKKVKSRNNWMFDFTQIISSHRIPPDDIEMLDENNPGIG